MISSRASNLFRLIPRVRQQIMRLVTIASHDDHGVDQHAADFQYQVYLNRPDIDGWELRRCMNEMLGSDMVPHPKVIIATLKACRRVNDYALTVRFLEGCRDKCGPKLAEIWPYIMQEIQGTLDELGCNSPEQMCFHHPELALESTDNMPAVERTIGEKRAKQVCGISKN